MKRSLTFLLLLTAFTLHADVIKCGSGLWVKHKQNFGMEKVSLSFPTRPLVTQNPTMTTATAWDNATCYTFTGYFPPIGNIHVAAMFEEMLNTVSQYPFSIYQHTTYQNTCGNWVLEYVAQDTYRNVTIYSFTVVTPFNAYTLQCIQPFGAKERYLFFRDSLQIYCECGY